MCLLKGLILQSSLGNEVPVQESPRPLQLSFPLQARKERLPGRGSIPPPPATSSASAMPSRTPRTSAASPSTHNRCAVHTGSRSVPSGHRPWDGRFGRAEVKADGSFPTVHPSAHSLALAYLKISRKYTGFETTSTTLRQEDHKNRSASFAISRDNGFEICICPI